MIALKKIFKTFLQYLLFLVFCALFFEIHWKSTKARHTLFCEEKCELQLVVIVRKRISCKLEKFPIYSQSPFALSQMWLVVSTRKMKVIANADELRLITFLMACPSMSKRHLRTRPPQPIRSLACPYRRLL